MFLETKISLVLMSKATLSMFYFGGCQNITTRFRNVTQRETFEQ